MSGPLVLSLAHNFDQALAVLATTIDDCPDELWETDLWPDEAPTGPGPYGGLVGSAPWLLSHHALTILDYDLTGDFEMWEPPAPFDENTWSFPNRVFTRAETVGYVEHCRTRVRAVLDGFDDETAARPLPETHRYAGQAYGVIVGSLPVHTIEHATQIRQFLTAAGVPKSAAARRASGDNTAD